MEGPQPDKLREQASSPQLLELGWLLPQQSAVSSGNRVSRLEGKPGAHWERARKPGRAPTSDCVGVPDHSINQVANKHLLRTNSAKHYPGLCRDRMSQVSAFKELRVQGGDR